MGPAGSLQTTCFLCQWVPRRFCLGEAGRRQEGRRRWELGLAPSGFAPCSVKLTPRMVLRRCSRSQFWFLAFLGAASLCTVPTQTPAGQSSSSEARFQRLHLQPILRLLDSNNLHSPLFLPSECQLLWHYSLWFSNAFPIPSSIFFIYPFSHPMSIQPIL